VTADERLVALTGATGFLGQRLAAALRTDGWRVRALVRREADAARLARAGLEPCVGDLSDSAALARLTAAAPLTIHCAGLIKARTRAEFMAVNGDGAARLACAVGGRLILISSLAAREPQLSPYAASKRAGEEAARLGAHGRLTILRPPAIYGPGDRETLALFRAAAWAAVLPLPGGPLARLALAHVDDVVAAILHLARAPPSDVAFAVGGAEPDGYGWRAIMGAAALAVGRAPRLVRAPAWAILGAGAVSEGVGRLRGAPIFTLGKARELLHADWSVTAAERAPAAPPARFSLAEGFADAVAWYRNEGWL